MAIDKMQESLIVVIGGLRGQGDDYAAQVSANAETQARQMLRVNAEIEKQIAGAPDTYAAAYGDGSAGTEADVIAKEIGARSVTIDALCALCPKTRAELEAEIAV